jgi:hypothetical protein
MGTLLDLASLVVVPSGYKEDKIYSVVPTDGSGDLDFTRASSATRVNSAGEIESVATGVPRLDYSQGSCPSLLLEPQGTNNLLRSEEFNNAYWRKNDTTITSSTESSPTSDNNSFILQVDNSSAVHSMDLPSENRISVASGVTYTSSVFVKKDPTSSNNIIQLVNRIASFGNSFANFNINTGIVTKEEGCTARIVPLNNGWYRISITATATASGTNDLIVCFTNNNPDSNIVPSYTGSTDERIIIWGAQLEEGAYPTSYIPTTTATVTRVADAASKTGISSLIGQTEGTIFIDFEYNQPSSDTNGRLLQLQGTTESIDSILPLIISSTNRFELAVFANGVNTFPIIQKPETTIPFGRQKFAIAYNAGVYTVYRNGSLFASGTGGAPTSLSAAVLGGSLFVPRSISNPINQALLFKTRLSNTELAQLTTL